MKTIFLLSFILATLCLVNAEASRLNSSGLVVFTATHCVDGDQYYIDARHTFKLKGTCGQDKRPKYDKCEAGVPKRYDFKTRAYVEVKNEDGASYDCSSDKKRQRD